MTVYFPLHSLALTKSVWYDQQGFKGFEDLIFMGDSESRRRLEDKLCCRHKIYFNWKGSFPRAVLTVTIKWNDLCPQTWPDFFCFAMRGTEMCRSWKQVYFCVIVKFNAQTYELTLPSRLQLLIHLFILKISKPKETKHCQLSLWL